MADIRIRASSAITEVKLAAVEEIRHSQQPAEVRTADTVFVFVSGIKMILRRLCIGAAGRSRGRTTPTLAPTSSSTEITSSRNVTSHLISSFMIKYLPKFYIVIYM